MSETTKVEQKKEYTAEDFAKEYQSLCEKTGWRVVVAPTWVTTNHGSFEMVLQSTVGRFPLEVVK